MDLEYKTIPLADLKFSPDGTGNGTVSGLASVFGNKDLQNDRVLPGAFKDGLDDFLRDGFISWGHDWDVPVATLETASETPTGLAISAEFHSTAVAQEKRTITQERLARGKSMGLSIGYSVNAGGAKTASDGVRELSSLKVYEVALTPVPANPLANVTSVKDRRNLTALKAWDGLTDKDAYDALSHDDKIALYYDLQTAGLLDSHDQKAAWTRAYINDLPDKAFALIDAGGKKDADGKTEPRSLRHFPHHDDAGAVDEAHVKNALGRIPQSTVGEDGKKKALAHVEAHAKKLGIDVAATDSGKSAVKGGQGREAKYGGMSMYVNPMMVPLPGSYEALQEDLQEAACEMLPAWAMGQLADVLDASDLGYDTCVSVIGSFVSEAIFYICADAWNDPDEGVFVRVPYTTGADGEPELGVPEVVQPAFVAARAGASPIEMASRIAGQARGFASSLKHFAGAKEGRMISGSNRDRLKTAMDGIDEARTHLQGLYDESEPMKDGSDLFIDFQRIKARRLGAAV